MIILQKLVLFASGMALLMQQSTDSIAVIVFFTVIIIGSLQTYNRKRPSLLMISYIIYMAFCLWDIRFCYFMPLVLYEIFKDKKWVLSALYIIILIYKLNNQLYTILILLIISAVSFLFQYLAVKNDGLEETLKKTRDSGEELTMMLKNKNKYLLEKQDYEIHLATLKERNRIAREIHDNVGHMLTRSILQTGAMMVVNENQNLDGQLNNLRLTLTDAMDTIRTSVHGLHEESVDLQRSIEQILNGMSEYKFQFDYDMEKDIPTDIKYCFLAVVKEATSNIVKHSNATFIAVVAREHPGFYQLIIKDNGDIVKTKAKPGIGLSNMRERVESLGGTFRINNEKGFNIFISISKQERLHNESNNN